MKKIPLTQGKFALVDDEDVELVEANGPWHAVQVKGNNPTRAPKWYAQNSQHVYMHRLLMNAGSGVQVDHKNGNGLDNRRWTIHNLRCASQTENARNRRKVHPEECSSDLIGVSYETATNSWLAQVEVRTGEGRETRKPICERFNADLDGAEIEAAHARDNMVRLHHLEFAKLNFPNEIWTDFPSKRELPSSSKHFGVSFKTGSYVAKTARPSKRKVWRGRLWLPSGKELACGIWATEIEACRSVQIAVQRWYPGSSDHVCQECKKGEKK